PQLLECLERHDKETVSEAEAAARDLVELEVFTGDAKGAIARCLARGREHLQTVEAAFAPIRDKNVPERIYLQSEIQDYTSLVEALQEIVDEWDERASAGGDAEAASVGAAAGGFDRGGHGDGDGDDDGDAPPSAG